jgi:predicted kinase
MPQNLIVMCGISCSGKSTAARKLQEALGIELISTDMHRKNSDLNKVSLDRNPLERFVVYYEALKNVEDILAQGSDVIIDGTFILRLLRQGAYYSAYSTGSNAYVVHCVCNDYGLIQQRYGHRKRNNTMFEAWSKIEGHNVKFREFEDLDREVLPDGRPVPIVRNDTGKSKADVLYSDGSETIDLIVDTLNKPEMLYLAEVEHG